MDTFPTWFFRDPTPPRKVRAPTPGRCWEIEDEDEIEVGIVRNEGGEPGEMDGGGQVGGGEKKEDEQDGRKKDQEES